MSIKSDLTLKNISPDTILTLTNAEVMKDALKEVNELIQVSDSDIVEDIKKALKPVEHLL